MCFHDNWCNFWLPWIKNLYVELTLKIPLLSSFHHNLSTPSWNAFEFFPLPIDLSQCCYFPIHKIPPTLNVSHLGGPSFNYILLLLHKPAHRCQEIGPFHIQNRTTYLPRKKWLPLFTLIIVWFVMKDQSILMEIHRLPTYLHKEYAPPWVIHLLSSSYFASIILPK